MSAEYILTPDVYLNHFSPADAQAEQIRRDISMVFIGVVCWDVLAYIPSDLKIIRRSRFNFVNFCFVVSRVMILIHMSAMIVVRSVPVDSYNLLALWYTLATAFVSIIITSSYLFLRRVLAIYNSERWVRWCFIFSWVALVMVSSTVIPLAASPTLFPETKFYMSGDLKPWVALSDWGVFVFDTAVIVAVSLKLGRASSADAEYSSNNSGNRVPWYSVLTGRHLPRFTRAILRGGQLYYLVTVGIMIFVGVVVSLPMISPVYGDLLSRSRM